MFKKILLPTDGSEASERAGQYAISTANSDGADIIILNVVYLSGAYSCFAKFK